MGIGVRSEYTGDHKLCLRKGLGKEIENRNGAALGDVGRGFPEDFPSDAFHRTGKPGRFLRSIPSFGDACVFK